MKPEYSIIQCSSMTDLYEWGMPDVLSEEKTFVQWTLVITNSEEAARFCLI